MLKFEQPFRPHTIYGVGTLSSLPDYIYGTKVMLVYGSGSIKHSGLYDEICDLLSDVDFIEFGGISSNPKLSIIRQAIEVAKLNNVDQIIAVGGGSVIDGAKAIAVGAKTSADIWQAYGNGYQVTDSIDILTIVTNVATGSETNDVSVIVNDQTNLKRSIKTPHIYPKVAIMDPSLTLTVNEYTTRYGIVDCFSHLLEQYFNNVDNQIVDDQIVSYLRNIIDLGPKLLADLDNLEYRDNHMYLSYMAYNCDIRNTVGGDFACHGLDYGLASVFDTTHGAGLAIITPNWLEYVIKHKPEKIAKFARVVFDVEASDQIAAATLGLEALRNWFKSLKAAEKYSDINVIIEEELLVEMINKSMVSYPLGNYYGLDEAAIREIYEMGN